MSRTDFYHDYVRDALIKAGWVVMKQFFAMPLADTRVEMDLLMERVEADGSKTRIVVEVKNFREEKAYVSELQKSIGQYLLYREVLKSKRYDYGLYLAVPIAAYTNFISSALIRELFQKHEIQLLLFNPQDSTLLQWNP